ncbi:hypothetical protein GCM10022224_009190 [Nonomuraea antimicrobica]|uniref:Uncharacterized protein n=1 Tax=Nonomuraea antimicrobica TaxID=561173 RepID=A0ABP7B5H7_9ACTN
MAGNISRLYAKRYECPTTPLSVTTSSRRSGAAQVDPDAVRRGRAIGTSTGRARTAETAGSVVIRRHLQIGERPSLPARDLGDDRAHPGEAEAILCADHLLACI